MILNSNWLYGNITDRNFRVDVKQWMKDASLNSIRSQNHSHLNLQNLFNFVQSFRKHNSANAMSSECWFVRGVIFIKFKGKSPHQRLLAVGRSQLGAIRPENLRFHEVKLNSNCGENTYSYMWHFSKQNVTTSRLKRIKGVKYFIFPCGLNKALN